MHISLDLANYKLVIILFYKKCNFALNIKCKTEAASPDEKNMLLKKDSDQLCVR